VRAKLVVSGLVTAVLAVLLLGLGGALGSAGQPVDLERLDRPAPELAGTTIAGRPFDLRSHRGSVVLVTVWASWCPPCREELPILDRTRRRLAARGLVLVGILSRDSGDRATALLRDLGITDLPTIDDPSGRLAVSWGATGVPETYLVDRDGRVVARSVGAVTPEWVARHVDPAVQS
jgi:cytochrome c biogenesis protein CcmG/thiol:disulfide interchange protein DsbE